MTFIKCDGRLTTSKVLQNKLAMDTVLDLEYCKQENTSGKGDFESELPLAEIYKLACNFYKG